MRDEPMPTIETQWARVRGKLRAEFGEVAYRSWLKPLTLSGVEDGEVRIYIENPEGASKEPVLIGVPFTDISDAKLILTDDLIAAARARLPQKAYGDGADIDEDQISQRRSEDNG